MKHFFKTLILCLVLFMLCSEAAKACRPKFFNVVTGTYMDWSGIFDGEFVFPWNTNTGYFMPITPPAPCSENANHMQLQHIPAIWFSADSVSSVSIFEDTASSTVFLNLNREVRS